MIICKLNSKIKISEENQSMLTYIGAKILPLFFFHMKLEISLHQNIEYMLQKCLL